MQLNYRLILDDDSELLTWVEEFFPQGVVDVLVSTGGNLDEI